MPRQARRRKIMRENIRVRCLFQEGIMKILVVLSISCLFLLFIPDHELPYRLSVVDAFGGTSSFSSMSQRQRRKKLSVSQVLERCISPRQVLQQVGCQIDAKSDPHGTLSSLVLVRLSKLIVTLDNRRQRKIMMSSHNDNEEATVSEEFDGLLQEQELTIWNHVASTLSVAVCNCVSLQQTTLDGLVEGTKAAAIISRILPDLERVWEPLATSWRIEASSIASKLQPHQLSGSKWAYDCFRLVGHERGEGSCWDRLPQPLEEAYLDLDLPFRIRPNCLRNIRDRLSLSNLVQQVNFCVDDIRVASNRVVKERRQTAWEGDEGVANFEYSGKSMETNSWSPIVRLVRDELHKITGIYYDGCLVNLYPDGGSGMRYHIDPDQGTLWDYETAAVSVGATRRFAFRPKATAEEEGRAVPPTQPHTFTLIDGDVTEMFGDCQTRFQHTVKKAIEKNEKTPRASLVFKKTFR